MPGLLPLLRPWPCCHGQLSLTSLGDRLDRVMLGTEWRGPWTLSPLNQEAQPRPRPSSRPSAQSAMTTHRPADRPLGRDLCLRSPGRMKWHPLSRPCSPRFPACQPAALTHGENPGTCSGPASPSQLPLLEGSHPRGLTGRFRFNTCCAPSPCVPWITSSQQRYWRPPQAPACSSDILPSSLPPSAAVPRKWSATPLAGIPWLRKPPEGR